MSDALLIAIGGLLIQLGVAGATIGILWHEVAKLRKRSHQDRNRLNIHRLMLTRHENELAKLTGRIPLDWRDEDDDDAE